ncbi:MAG: ketopantoate reductase [Oscillospiraceae bacterium]|nr:ketopantoate reductase [Oscillospiraceae bacterium]
MEILVCGAGTIGLTYAWLLSRHARVDVLVREARLPRLSQGVPIACKDLRAGSHTYETTRFTPRCVTVPAGRYDAVLVAVNSVQLPALLPALAALREQTGCFVWMQNQWNLREKLRGFIPEEQCLVAFPSSVGGGRDEGGLRVILFDAPTRLGGPCRQGAEALAAVLRDAGLRTRWDPHIFDWLQVHYLQQSITAGAILENGGFDRLAADRRAVGKLVLAFREGIEVCRRMGVPTWRTFPAPLFRLPAELVAGGMQRMFQAENTVEMVENHKKQGLPEWIAGYYEVLRAGQALGLPMPVWASYQSALQP